MEKVEDGKKIVQMWMPSHLNLTYNLNLRHLRIDEKYRTPRDQEIVEALDASDAARQIFENVEPEAEPAVFLTNLPTSEFHLLPSTVMGSKALSAAGTDLQILTDEGDGEDETGGENLGHDDDDDDSRADGENEYDQEDDDRVYIGANGEDLCYDPDSDDFFEAIKGFKIQTSSTTHTIPQFQALVKDLKHYVGALLLCTDMPMSYYDTLVGDFIPFFDDGMHYHINNRLRYVIHSAPNSYLFDSIYQFRDANKEHTR